jgi:hypothetical protein
VDGKALFIDLDHNGMVAVVARLLLLGAPRDVLADPNRFRYCEPEDAEHLARIIADAAEWVPDVAIVDCVGELMALRGANSDNADEYTATIGAVVMPLVRAGAGAILIDHMAKGKDSRAYGAGGTMAKRRKLGGTSIRAVPIVKLTPGRGGQVRLFVKKDRHGGVKQHCGPSGDDGGTFVLTESCDGTTSWHITEPGSQHEVPRAGEPSKGAKRYVQPARKLTEDAGDFTASTLAALVHGHPYTDAQRKAARRYCDELADLGLLAVTNFGDGSPGDPRRWRWGGHGDSGDTDELCLYHPLLLGH